MNVSADVHAYRRTTRRALFGLLAALGVLFIAALAALVFIAHHENQHQLEHSEADARRAILSSIEVLGRAVKDYAVWDDAWRHLGAEPLDLHWAIDDNNLGPAMASTYSLEGIFLLGPDGATRFSIVQGVPRVVPVARFVTGDLAPLLAAAREQGPDGGTVYGFYEVGGQPAVVHAAVLRPQRLPDGARMQDYNVLLFIDVFDHTRLQQWIQDYELNGLMAELASAPAEDQASVVVPADYGSALRLRWYAEAPGDAFVRTLLPLLALAMLVSALMAGYFYRSALRTALLIDAGREQAQYSQARFRAVAEAASDWIWETDAQGWLTYLCERFEGATGHVAAEWIGRPLVTLLEYNHPLFASNALADAPGRWRQVPCRLLDASGAWHDCQLMVRAVLAADQVVGYRGSVLDVSGAMGSAPAV